MKKLILSLVVGLIGFSSCSKDNNSPEFDFDPTQSPAAERANDIITLGGNCIGCPVAFKKGMNTLQNLEMSTFKQGSNKTGSNTSLVVNDTALNVNSVSTHFNDWEFDSVQGFWSLPQYYANVSTLDNYLSGITLDSLTGDTVEIATISEVIMLQPNVTLDSSGVIDFTMFVGIFVDYNRVDASGASFLDSTQMLQAFYSISPTQLSDTNNVKMNLDINNFELSFQDVDLVLNTNAPVTFSTNIFDDASLMGGSFTNELRNLNTNNSPGSTITNFDMIVK